MASRESGQQPDTLVGSVLLQGWKVGCCSGRGGVATKVAAAVEVGCHSGGEWAAAMEEGGLLQQGSVGGCSVGDGLLQFQKMGCRSGGGWAAAAVERWA